MHHRSRTTVALLLLFAAATASAQFSGPGARAPASLPMARTVAEIVRDATDDRPVELTGYLLRQTGRETFVFKDDTGEITVEIDAEDFPADQPLTPQTRVRINGEVESRLLRAPLVEVEQLQLLPATPTPAPASSP